MAQPNNQNRVTGSLPSWLKAGRMNLVLTVLGFAPLLWCFLVVTWHRPVYQFYPLALLGAAALAWRAGSETEGAMVPGRLGDTRIWGGAAMGMALLANAVWSPWLGYIAFLLGLAAFLWGLGGRTLLFRFGPVLALLLVILPPPLGLDESLTLRLRAVAVGASSRALDWLRVIHARDGNTIVLPEAQLLVEEACSGINSFVLCNALCVFWLLWQRRPLWWLIPGLLATSLFVVLGNVIRITVGVAADYYWQVNLLHGGPHEVFGLVLLLGYGLLILSGDQLLLLIAGRAEESAPDSTPPPPPAPLHPPPAPLPPPVLGFKYAGALLAVVSVGLFMAHLALGGSPGSGRRHILAPLPVFGSARELKLALPDQVAGWRRVSSGGGDQSLVQTLGVYSSVWHFQRAGLEASVAVDYPLDGYHDVRVCYKNNGWQVQGEEKLFQSPSHEDLHATELTLLKPVIDHAVVFHSVMDGQGNWLTAPNSVGSEFVDTTTLPTSYRIQLMTGSYSPLTGEEDRLTRELFLQARQLLAPQILEQLHQRAR